MKINAIDESGKLKEYDVILIYHSDDYNKDYIVYTDNIYNSNNELQIVLKIQLRILLIQMNIIRLNLRLIRY